MIVVNPIMGGGLSLSKLQAATATAADVVVGKTFYSGSKTLKTGTRTGMLAVHGSAVSSRNTESTSTELGFVPDFVLVQYQYSSTKDATLELYQNSAWTTYIDGYIKPKLCSLSGSVLVVKQIYWDQSRTFSYWAVKY